MDNSPTAELSWIDSVPDFPVFVAELTDFVQNAPGGMQHWAMTRWASRADPRGQARDMVRFAEQSEEGKALVAAWRSTAEIYGNPELLAQLTKPLDGDHGPVPMPEWPEPVRSLRRARQIAEETEDPLLADIFKAAEVNVVAQLLVCGHRGHDCHSVCNLIDCDDLLASTLHLARAMVEYDEQTEEAGSA